MKRWLILPLTLLVAGIAWAAWDGSTNFPSSLDTSATLYDVEDLGTVEDEHHDAMAQAIIAIQTKLGIGADVPADNEVYVGSGAGSAGYENEATFKASLNIESLSKSFIINAATTADDFLLWRTDVAITITDIYGVLLTGTNVVGGLDECDSDGANPVAVDADITFDGSLDQDDGSLTNGTIDAGDWVKWHTTSVNSPGYLTVTINGTID